MRHLSRLKTHLAALTIALLAGSYLVLAQAPAGGQGRGPAGPPPPMSFFITSASKGDGANYGGLAGADAYCQQLATAAGRGAPVTWHAYLSTQGAGAVNARDRIGNGPWYNARGQMVGRGVAQMHGDTIERGAPRRRARQAILADREEGHRQRRRRHAEPARHPDRLAA